MAQEVLLYHSGIAGAPSATINVLGGLIAVLDACLVTGFNLATISTLTRTGDVATATTSAGHNFSVGDWVDVSGADQAAYNGRVNVLSKPASNQFTYAVTGSPTSPATGASISAKHPGAGWSKAFSGINTAVYTTGAGSLGHSMQVEDNNPYTDSNVGARTRIVKDASGIPDSGTQLGEQCRIQKANGGWVLVADSKTCYVVMAAVNVFHFGEFASYRSDDLFNFLQSRGENAAVAAGTYQGSSQLAGRHFPAVRHNADNPALSILRANSQIGAHVFGDVIRVTQNPGATLASVNNQPIFHQQAVALPNAADNSVPLVPYFVLDDSPMVLRGRLRGAFYPLGLMPTGGFTNNIQLLDDVVIDGALRKVALCRFGGGGVFQIAFDLGDGPWS